MRIMVWHFNPAMRQRWRKLSKDSTTTAPCWRPCHAALESQDPRRNMRGKSTLNTERFSAVRRNRQNRSNKFRVRYYRDEHTGIQISNGGTSQKLTDWSVQHPSSAADIQL